MTPPTPKSKSKSKSKSIKEEDEKKMELTSAAGGTCVFPTSKIRRLVGEETEEEVRISHEAAFLINKASQFFLQTFTADASVFASSDADANTTPTKKKAKKNINNLSLLAYDHLSSVVSTHKRYDFLSDFVPLRVRAQDAFPSDNVISN